MIAVVVEDPLVTLAVQPTISFVTTRTMGVMKKLVDKNIFRNSIWQTTEVSQEAS